MRSNKSKITITQNYSLRKVRSTLPKPPLPKRKIKPKPEIKLNMAAIIEKVQKQIINFIPEFSGLNSELPKFISCADFLYDAISEPEKIVFNTIIKYRLVGEAFKRINKRNIETYDALKNTLNEIYSETFSLQELNQQCFSCTQKYNEQIKQFGFRINELLHEYKNGFKVKYNTVIDNGLEQHLEEQAIQTFKNGLNNTILKEKIATIRSEKLNDIIRETEIVEKMLAHTTNSHNYTGNSLENRNSRINNIPQKQIIICNFCSRPNHSWKDCRIRMRTEIENRNRNNQSQFNRPNYNNWNQQQNNSYAKYNQVTTPTQGFKPQQQQFRHENNQNTKYYTGQQKFNEPNYSQKENYNRYNQIDRSTVRFNENTTEIPNGMYNKPQFYPNQQEQKFCRYCKNFGHNIQECRSKMYTDSRNEQHQQKTNLVDEFNKLKIYNINKSISPEETQQDITSINDTNSENRNGFEL